MSRPNPVRPLLRLLAPLAAALAPACASYPERTGEAFDAFRAGAFERAEELYAREEVTDSAFLSGVEAGTAALTAGDFEAALEHFERAAVVTRDLEERALLGAARLGETLGTWALSDAARSYEGEGFERVYLHVCLGLAYLGLGAVQDVRVEARLANRLLETEEELYEARYRAGGLGHFLSAVAYELEGALDEAYIDYRRMVEKDLGAALAGPRLVRLARWLGREDELERWVEEFGEAPPLDPEAARVVVVAGVGVGPYKTEHRLFVPLRGGSFAMAAAEFLARPQTVPALRLDSDDGVSCETVVVEDVAAVSRKNLEDRLAWQVVRSATRGVLKRQLTRKLEREHGGLGRLFGELFTIFTERADLRSWLTLPDTWQAARLEVRPGVRTLRLRALGGESVELGSYALEPGETLFVLIRTLGPRVYAHVVGGVPVETTAAPSDVPSPATP